VAKKNIRDMCVYSSSTYFLVYTPNPGSTSGDVFVRDIPCLCPLLASLSTPRLFAPWRSSFFEINTLCVVRTLRGSAVMKHDSDSGQGRPGTHHLNDQTRRPKE